MSEYRAPLKDMQFVLRELVDLPQLLRLPGHEGHEPELLASVLEQAAAFATGVLSPLNRSGDVEGCRFQDGAVSTPAGWRQAYQRLTEDGWNALGITEALGGAGLPAVIAAMAEEMWNGANCAFALCPMLTRSGIEALALAADASLRQTFLPALVAGRWTATMNLTEPQAGSDLAAVKTRAVPQADGSFQISGQKIFITYGEHDLTPNIVHLVLARTPNAPAGVKGISLFVVPKFLLKADGSIGSANAVRCLSIEHKLGIHGSPTCVMQFGSSNTAATGWLVGAENRGLEYMFVMMNAARFSVGVQGLGLAERSYQSALAFARERRQGTEPASGSGDSVAIIEHPDVRRMLLQMRSTVEAMRALAAVVAEASDQALSCPDTEQRERAQALVGLLTPVVKGWMTEAAVGVTSLGIQIHGGMGYIEETGVAQYLRDARITTIYEGTTGIQANDLVGRKLLRDQGRTAQALMASISQVLQPLAQSTDASLPGLGAALDDALQSLQRALDFVLRTDHAHAARSFAGAVPLLTLFGTVCGGWQMARAALAAQRRLSASSDDADFYRAKILSAQFFAHHQLSQCAGLAAAIIGGADPIIEMAADQF